MKTDSSMNKKKECLGFTLVELIVVIAVLAVLAGVAYPVYTGYIEKANEAADLTLLGAINEAFASALYDVGYTEGLPEATFELDGEMVRIGENGAVKLIDKLLPDLTDSENINGAFSRFYKGNEDKKFKIFETLIYDPMTGGFGGEYGNVRILGNKWRMETKDNGDGSKTFSVTDGEGNKYNYTLKNDDINSFNESTFGTNMELSSLMGEVDNVVQAVKSLLTAGPTSYETLEGLLGEDYINSLGLSREEYPDGSEGDDAYAQALTNAIVMHVADSSAEITADDILNSTQKFKELDTLTSMAALYGVATAYANSDIGRDSTIVVDGESMTVKEYYDKQSDALRNVKDPAEGLLTILDLLSNLEDSEKMNEYMSSESYRNDLNGYLAAMNALAGNRDTLVEQGALDCGFADDDLGAILDALFS